MSKPEITTEIVKITPEDAAELLESNTFNRTLRPGKVSQYSNDMKAGRWKMDGAPIRFAWTGKMLDGQHRLWAVIEAGVPVEFLVVRGLEPDSQDVMDSGAGRKASDALLLHGYHNVNNLSSVIRMCILFENTSLPPSSRFNVRNQVSNAQIIDYIDKHPDVVEDVNEVLFYRNRMDVPVSVMGFVFRQLKKISEEDAKIFLHKVATGEALEYGDPILALRSRLREVDKNQQRVKPSTFAAILFRTWNSWRKGQKLTSVVLVYKGKSVSIPDVLV